MRLLWCWSYFLGVHWNITPPPPPQKHPPSFLSNPLLGNPPHLYVFFLWNSSPALKIKLFLLLNISEFSLFCYVKNAPPPSLPWKKLPLISQEHPTVNWDPVQRHPFWKFGQRLNYLPPFPPPHPQQKGRGALYDFVLFDMLEVLIWSLMDFYFFSTLKLWDYSKGKVSTGKIHFSVEMFLLMYL